MAFRPSIHGWPFGNVYSCTPYGLGIGAPPLPELGLGGGLCWSALDRYLQGTRIDRGAAAPEEGDPLHAEFVRRQVSALAGVWPQVREWHMRSDGSWRDRLPVRIPIPGRDLASLTRSEWPGIRKRLERDEPVLLTLLPEADRYTRSRAAWQLLATAYTRQAGRVVLSVYDPGSPNDDEVQLRFSLAGELDASLTGGRVVRGFFMVPYDRTPQEPLRAETFEDSSVIGMNRTVRGTLSAVAWRSRLDLVARDPDGALIHFRRSRNGRWEGANVTERPDLGSHELHSDPVAVGAGRALHVFAGSYVGDLIHFRLGRSWKVFNRTDHRRAGPRFRLAGRPLPVAGPRLRLSVLGRDENGGLIHYDGAPLGRWRGEQVAGEPLAEEPVACWVGPALHVVGRSRRDHLIHWERDEDRWTTTDLSESGNGPRVRLAGRPTLAVREGRFQVFGRDPSGRLFVVTPGPDGVWQRSIIAGNIAGDPTATTGPAGLHVFAPTDGGILHAWHAGDWRSEDIAATRPTLSAQDPLDGPIACWGSAREMRVFGRRDGRVVVYAWDPGADWTVGPLGSGGAANGRHFATDPTLVVDGGGRPHLVGTDRGGSVLHVEPGPWSEPGAEEARGVALPASDRPGRSERAGPRRRPAGIPAEPSVAAAGDRLPGMTVLDDEDADLGLAVLEDGEVVDPLPLVEDPDEADPEGPLEPERLVQDPAEPEPVVVPGFTPGVGAAEDEADGEPAVIGFDVERQADPDPAGEGEVLKEAPIEERDSVGEANLVEDADPVEDAPVEEADAGEAVDAVGHADAVEDAPAGGRPVEYDALEEGAGDGERVEVYPVPAAQAAPEPDRPGEPAGQESAAPGKEPDPPVDGAAEKVAAEGAGPGDSDSGSDAGEEPDPAAGGGVPDELEPMDLSLLGSWPPPSPSLRRKRRKRGEEEGDGRREAS